MRVFPISLTFEDSAEVQQQGEGQISARGAKTAEAPVPTPTTDRLARRFSDFDTLGDALDYAAEGERGLNFHDARGTLTRADLSDVVHREIGLSRADLDKSDDWFKRHGSSTVLLGRLVPAALDVADVGRIEAHARGELFLRHPALDPPLRERRHEVVGGPLDR